MSSNIESPSEDYGLEEFLLDTISRQAMFVMSDDDGEVSISPFITFYVSHDEADYLRVANTMIAICEEFSTLIDEPFQLLRDSDSANWLPSTGEWPTNKLRAQAKRARRKGDAFLLGATDMDSHQATARWAVSGKVSCGGNRYSWLKLTFRDRWYLRHQSRWHAFAANCVQSMQPAHCYSGFEVACGVGDVLGAMQTDEIERPVAERLYGLDIDHPIQMGRRLYEEHPNPSVLLSALMDIFEFSDLDRQVLGSGLRTPTWSFLISPYWLAQLGKDEADVRAELDDPRIEITTIPSAVGPHNSNGEPALWIRLGELDLHPVENGVPDLLVKASRLIRPIRCDGIRLRILSSGSSGADHRFDDESSLRWMRRFDEDSDWPTAEKRNIG